MLRLFVVITLLLWSFLVPGQTAGYNFLKLNTYNGLSHNQVNAILKDGDGFMWFGTMSGLNRYDGYSFKTFRKKSGDSTSLKDNYVFSLFELPGGKIWVTTRGGPCIYDSRQEQFEYDYYGYLHSLGLPPGSVVSIIKGQNGRYWFLYDNLDLYSYSVLEKKAVPFIYGPGSNLNTKLASLKETPDGKLWLVYQNGLLQEYDIKSGRAVFGSTALQKFNKEDIPYNLMVDNDGDLWLWCYAYGVFLFHPGDSSVRWFRENSFSSKLNSDLISQVIQDDNGLIWVATDHGGVTLIDKKHNFKTDYLVNDPKDPKTLSQNSITALYKDDQGIIWLGTYKQGVDYLNSSIVQFPLYHHLDSNPGSLQYDDVNRFVEDQSGNIWIGTNGGGLIYFDRKANTFKQYLHDPGNKKSICGNVIVSLCLDHSNMLWVGTYFGGLDRYDGTDFVHYTHTTGDSSSLSNNNVWEIFEDRENNLWVGTLGGGLDLLDRKTNRFKHYQNRPGEPGFPVSNYISAILQDRSGDIWIGTDNGVSVFNMTKNTSLSYQHDDHKNSLCNNNIVCLLEDSKGRIWIGTREGLNLFDKQTKNFQAFTMADGLPDNMILNILEDQYHTFWLSTPNGLCNAVAEQKGNSIALSVISYDEINNLQSEEFNDNAAYKTRSGELVFGGPSGFNIINPSSIKKQVYHPKIVFTGLQILNNEVEPGALINNRVLLPQSITQLQHIDLKYRENVFSIEFASLDFAHSTRDKYAYMLERFNSDWLYADGSQGKATYTNLDPGHYIFKVKAQNRSGLWSEIKSLEIIIQPPFWKTPVAYLVYALLGVGLLLLLRRITLDRVHMRYEVEQQRREAERAHAMEQVKTKFFTNVSHEFRTPLSLIIAPMEKIIKQTADEEQREQLNLVQRNAKRLLGLVNQLLDFRKMQVQEIKLHPSVGDIVGFIRDITHSFMDIAEKKTVEFSFSSNVERLEILFDKDKIEKILFNLLSNAFKYTHDKGMVGVHLTYNPPAGSDEDGTLAIEIRDTGIGIPPDKQEKIFERFFQTDVPESMVNQGTGIGLAITKEFVKLHKGIITVKSEPEKGSVFTVLLPAKKVFEPAAHLVSTAPVETEDPEPGMPEEGHKKDRKRSILIVEDNEDLRFYLKDNLKGQYHVEEAMNGKEGWEKVKRFMPDLVVSDIMMPVMDGIELARKIKNETLTAHIPVILLTAMGSEEKQLEGLKVGVNDYITKPFTFEILASRMRNLIAQQKILQKKFQKQIEVNPGEVTITPVDEKFLKQALEVVEKHLDKPEFSVEDFSREMFMNRVTLYRKILSLTGRTPLEFIRSIRLKKAAQLLGKSGLSVAEIAYEVGFNNPKNFTKLFKEEFSILPSQYAEGKRDESL